MKIRRMFGRNEKQKGRYKAVGSVEAVGEEGFKLDASREGAIELHEIAME